MIFSGLRAFITTPLADALGRSLLHFLWEGAAAAAVLGLALLCTRSARVRYAFAVAALAALPVSFAATVTIMMRTTRAERIPLQRSAVLATSSSEVSPTPAGGPSAPADRIAWLAPLWIAGVLLCYARSMAGWRAAQRLRTRGVCAATPEWQQRVARLAAGIRLSRRVAVLESCLVEVPATMGCLRPVILMPVGMLAGLPGAQVEAILLHELAHIRRCDYVVNLLQTAVDGLLFYHPAVWWIGRVIRAERENCCDDVVASRSDARAYAAALANIEDRRAAAAALLAANGGNLMRRVRRLLGQPEPQRSAITPSLAIGIALGAFAAALAWAQVQPAPQENIPAVYQKWLSEDVAYIITTGERTAFQALTTDQQREQFIQQFWAMRDPTPGTLANEFKEEHYRRIAFSNEHFAGKAVAGWKSDRGHAYIVYGPPDEIEDHPGDAATPPRQSWRYRYIERIGSNVVVEFADPGRDGTYPMTRDPGLFRR